MGVHACVPDTARIVCGRVCVKGWCLSHLLSTVGPVDRRYRLTSAAAGCYSMAAAAQHTANVGSATLSTDVGS